jgi:hypothetical protein
MNKKFVGFIVCSLLIIATVLPVAGNIKDESNSPSRAINTYVDIISPYNQPSNPLTMTATGPSDLNAVELHYRWSSNNITWTGENQHSIFEGFESGSQNTSLWSTFQAGNNARIQWNYGFSHNGSYACAMDDYDTNQGDTALNIIYTVFDFSGTNNINLEFYQREWDDEGHDAPQSWSGWGNYDVVAFTNNGNNWYEIVPEAYLNTEVYTKYNYDISSDPDFEYPVTSNFAISFQQFDNYQLTSDGRAWDDITIDYTTGAPSHDWVYWGVDTSYPWSWNFNFPEDHGYYEFYTIGKKTGELDETPPTNADAICRFNEDPEIFDEKPPDGSADVPRVPEMEISVSDAEEETMDIKWYSNSEGSWEIFATNIGVEDGTYSQTNENFSEYSTTYYWYVTVSDGVYNKQSPTWSFTTEANQPPNTPNSPSPADGETNVNINKVLTWIGGDPNPGDSVKYDVYFGKSSSPPLVAEGISQSAYAPGTLDLETKYYWKINAEDDHGLTANGPLWEFTTQSEPNDPPEAPDIYGPPSGPPAKQLFWAFSSFDPDGHDVKYIIDWGDGDTHETGYYPESKAVEASHTYTGLGDYTIIIKAEDEKGLQGPESSFDVTITRSKTANQRLLHLLFERFPLLERLMNLFIFC